jgi:hypothetical protein
MVAQAVVAGLLAIRLYIDPKLYWRDLWALFGWLVFEATLVWLLFFASWTARVAAAGFALGAILEIAAFCFVVDRDWITFAPGTGAPQGMYPLTLPISRLVTNAQIQPLDAPLLALCLAATLSGLIVTAISLPCWRLVQRVFKQSLA